MWILDGCSRFGDEMLMIVFRGRNGIIFYCVFFLKKIRYFVVDFFLNIIG